MNDEHLVPEVIKSIAASVKNTSGNEQFMAIARLEAIVKYCRKHLPKEKN